MLFQKLIIAATLAAIVAAQEISRDDIPRQCTQVCAQVVTIARDCDNQNDSDRAELQCICNAPNASTLLPACESCVRQYDTDSDDDDDDDDSDDSDDDVNDNDVREVLNRCNFASQSSFKPASAGPVAASAASTTLAAIKGNAVVTSTSSTNVVTSTVAPSQVTQNAAPAVTAAAGMGIGALGFALGML